MEFVQFRIFKLTVGWMHVSVKITKPPETKNEIKYNLKIK